MTVNAQNLTETQTRPPWYLRSPERETDNEGQIMHQAPRNRIKKQSQWRWLQAALLSVPPLLLVVLGLWLHNTQPAELVVTEARFKLLPRPLAHPLSVVQNPNRPTVAMQIVLFLGHPPDAKPVWWGSAVGAGPSDAPCFTSSGGQRRFIYLCVLNKATFDPKRQQYRTVLECIIPDTPAFTRDSTFTTSIELWQNGRIVGEGAISTPVMP